VQDRRPPQGVFVGRAAEVARVTEVIARVTTGQPWLVAIEGDPGVGKTALARCCLAGAEGVSSRVLLDEVASLAAALGTESLDDEAVRRLHQDTGGHPLYLRTLLSEGSGFDPSAPGRAALPPSLAAAIGDHLRGLPPETRVILEMLAVLNLRMPLAQLGQAAQIGSPSAAIEPAVAAGLVDWRPEEPTCPVAIRHLLVRGRYLCRHPGRQAPPAARPRRLGGQRGGVVEAPGGRPGPAG
jgi:AAA ATPase domain